MKELFRKKNLQQLIVDAGDPNVAHEGGGGGLRRSLGAFNLTMLGVGAIIGAGIFSLTGAAAAFYAGPAIVYSFVIGGILCALAGLCYAEMAAMVPVAGSAYAYSYATMGELVAWIIGWDLILEYAFGSVAVSSSWSGYLVSLLHKTMGLEFSDTVLRFTKGPWELVTLGDGSQIHGFWNLPASLLALAVGYVLVKGVQESALINNIIVLVKCAIILLFIVLGWSVVDHANWIGDASVTGLMSLVPPRGTTLMHGKEIISFGLPGVLTGAGVVFFAYIGFDALSTTAQECRNPKRDLPIGILASLVVCTVLYVLVALVLTGVVPYRELGVPDPVAVGIDRIVALRGWSPFAQKGFTFMIKLGALAGLTSVVLVLMMGQARIFYAMAKDGLLPWFHKVHPRHATPHIATIVTALFISFCAGLMPISLVGELVSIGTLLAFVLVCAGIPILRFTHPDVERPFRTPAYWLVAPAGAIACLWVMSGLPADTWWRLIIWLVIGMGVYIFYGRRNSRLRNVTPNPEADPQRRRA
jgi:APA family basic amino acid/polyamine antiporter